MKITNVSSAELLSGPWSTDRFIPADPSPEAVALDATLRLLARLRQAHPETAPDSEWDTALGLVRQQAATRARRALRPHLATATDRADRALLLPLLPGEENTRV